MIGTEQISSRYTPEMGLVILSGRVYFHTATAADLHQFVATHTINWPLFAHMIAAHQIRPFVYKVLSAHIEDIDGAFLETLRANCFKIAAGNMLKAEELVRIAGIFSDKGIKCLAYKGVVLSNYLFSDLISRETADIDLLLQPADFRAAMALLVQDGYEVRFYNPQFEEEFLKTSHELLFKKTTPRGTIKIELHWRVTAEMMNIPLPNDDMMSQTGTVTILGHGINVPGIKQHLLALMVHHGVNDVWRTLRHVLDLSLFAVHYGDIINDRSFVDAAGIYRIRHTTETGFRIARLLFGIPVPPVFQSAKGDLPEALINNLLEFPALPRNKLSFTNFRQQLYLRDTTGDRMRLTGAYILTGIRPNVRDMEAVSLGRKWYFLYYIIKPFRLLFRK